MWQIKPPEGKGVVSYLFGSIHVPHAKVYPSLSKEVMEAFKVFIKETLFIYKTTAA